MDLETLLNKMGEAPKALTTLMKDLKSENKPAFKKVLRGFPEKGISSYGGDIGVCYLKKINFEDDLDDYSRPESLIIILGIVCKGTKTQAHDKITKLTLDVTRNVDNDPDWFTLKGNVASTVIIDHEIFIEQMKNSLLTTSVFELECSLDFSENDSENSEKEIVIDDGLVTFDD